MTPRSTATLRSSSSWLTAACHSTGASLKSPCLHQRTTAPPAQLVPGVQQKADAAPASRCDVRRVDGRELLRPGGETGWRELLGSQQPFVLTHFVEDWPAHRLWTAPYLVRTRARTQSEIEQLQPLSPWGVCLTGPLPPTSTSGTDRSRPTTAVRTLSRPSGSGWWRSKPPPPRTS